jgi:hypothetical protein
MIRAWFAWHGLGLPLPLAGEGGEGASLPLAEARLWMIGTKPYVSTVAAAVRTIAFPLPDPPPQAGEGAEAPAR